MVANGTTLKPHFCLLVLLVFSVQFRTIPFFQTHAAIAPPLPAGLQIHLVKFPYTCFLPHSSHLPRLKPGHFHCPDTPHSEDYCYSLQRIETVSDRSPSQVSSWNPLYLYQSSPFFRPWKSWLLSFPHSVYVPSFLNTSSTDMNKTDPDPAHGAHIPMGGGEGKNRK